MKMAMMLLKALLPVRMRKLSLLQKRMLHQRVLSTATLLWKLPTIIITSPRGVSTRSKNTVPLLAKTKSAQRVVHEEDEEDEYDEDYLDEEENKRHWGSRAKQTAAAKRQGAKKKTYQHRSRLLIKALAKVQCEKLQQDSKVIQRLSTQLDKMEEDNKCFHRELLLEQTKASGMIAAAQQQVSLCSPLSVTALKSITFSKTHSHAIKR